MSNEEAIKWMKSIKERIHGGDEWFDEKRKEAIDRAIEALKEQKHAHWKKSKTTEGMIYCSLCHCNHYVYKMPFCDLCGARMDEEEGAEE